jgi:hypothetical protein
MGLILIIFGALFILQLWWGVVGVYGGGIERSENPPLYWLAMALMGACLATLAYFHFTGA